MFRQILAAALLAGFGLGIASAQPPLEDTVRLQFPAQTDVKEMLALYERLTGRRLIYDSTAQGFVQLMIDTPLAKEEAARLIEIALLHNQFSLVRTESDQNIWKVFGIGKKPHSGGVPIYSDKANLPDDDQLVTFFIKLQYADPAKVAPQINRALTNYLQRNRTPLFPKAQALLVSDTASNIRRVVQLAEQLDRVAAYSVQ